MLKKVTAYPPYQPDISETAFSHRFQKVYTYPPVGSNILGHRTESSENLVKVKTPTALAHYGQPPREREREREREIYIHCTSLNLKVEHRFSNSPKPAGDLFTEKSKQFRQRPPNALSPPKCRPAITLRLGWEANRCIILYRFYILSYILYNSAPGKASVMLSDNSGGSGCGIKWVRIRKPCSKPVYGIHRLSHGLRLQRTRDNDAPALQSVPRRRQGAMSILTGLR